MKLRKGQGNYFPRADIDYVENVAINIDPTTNIWYKLMMLPLGDNYNLVIPSILATPKYFSFSPANKQISFYPKPDKTYKVEIKALRVVVL